MDLFEQHRQQAIDRDAPLAARMRPRTLADYIGQDHILGPGRLLRRAIQADQLSSLIFYGPPGTGKTTLAMVIANTTRAHFISINAVLAGVKDIREAIATAQEQRGMYDRRTILFVDEVHRFNKSQQDALLPWVENGTVILIGATTENPYFEVNKALVSRSRVFQLKPLTESDLNHVLNQALMDGDRGYGSLKIQIDDAARNHLVNVANGDARALLNALELAVETTQPNEYGDLMIPLAVAEESIQQRAVLYDKEGDAHFDTISAFIKSVRGSDPDAVLYWLARMVYAGEDPRFIFRRMVILASEDVGLADPNAVVVVMGCAAAFDRVGMPEGRYPLAQAALYLATCPKSNSTMGFFDALAAVQQEREADVPLHLRDATRDKHSFGHGKGYLYPHSYREHWVEQQYLPSSLQGQVFYQPSAQGYEEQIRVQVARRREAQLAALVEGVGVALPEGLTFSPTDTATERWLQRALGQAGDRLAELRDRLFDLAPPQRHHVVLDLNAGSGLLTWEAVRRVPEGAVYAWVHHAADQLALEEQATLLPELSRPVVVYGAADDLASVLRASTAATQTAMGDAPIAFDRIVGRNYFATHSPTAGDRPAQVAQVLHLLQPDGVLLLAETIPRYSQRLYAFLDATQLNPALYQTLQQAEDAIYDASKNSDETHVMTWDEGLWQRCMKAAGVSAQITVIHSTTELLISPGLIQRWFTRGADSRKGDRAARPSYADYLASALTEPQLAQVQAALTQRLAHQTVSWAGAIALMRVHP
ncbi:MAG: AAA family ATPase [Kaiparowitsia implicata GSE-PSE-MK54-09C]|jgi:putative ATPase|nr:AAA family ATPase [Kaiparowitsia implicata GSE-PSE-MK54-09C]